MARFLSDEEVSKLLGVENEIKKELGKITKVKTMFNSSNNILLLSIMVDYDNGFSQDICGLVLDDFNEALDRREGSKFGCELIRRLLEIFEVDDLSEIKNRYIKVVGIGSGLRFKPKGFELLGMDGKDILIYEDILKEIKC